MNRLSNSKYLIDFILLYVPLLLIELIFRLVSGYSIIDTSTLRIGIGLFFITGVITYFLNFINVTITRIIQFLLVSVASIYATAQMGFYNFLGMYISIQESSQMGAVTDYIKDFVRSFKPTFFLPLIVMFIFPVLSIIFRKKFKDIKKLSLKSNTLVSSLIIILSVFAYYGTLSLSFFDDKYQTTSNKDLFLTVSNTTNSVTKFGTSAFALLDIRQKLFPVSVQESYVSLSGKNKNTLASNFSTIEGISDFEWEKIIEATDNQDFQALNEYFTSLARTSENEYTGLFEGKDVIFILMESVNDIIVEYPKYYPNFAKIMKNSYYFKNNYSPRNACATLNNEFSGMTSIYSVSKVCTGKEYVDNTYFQSVFNLFNKQDYTTFSAHDYTEHYYPRTTFHKNMGSKDYYGVERLNIEYSDEYINWANDDEFMAEVLKIINSKSVDGKNYMTWLTTVSSHQPYGVSSIQGDKYLDLTKDTEYPDDVRRYMSKLKIVDNALGVLIDGLEKQGKLSDTVIVLYGDHYPYGLSTDHLNEVLPYDTAEDKNAEKVPFLIYNSELEGKVFEQYTTYINILPTVANLLNLDYDPRLMMGDDLLSNNYESLVVFADGSWKNENAYYDASSNKVNYYNDKYTEEDIHNITLEVSTKLKVSTKVIETNYFAYLERVLSEADADNKITPVILDEKTCKNELAS